MRPKGYKCSNVKCDSCVGHSMCGELGDAAMNCVDRIITRQTNADRIRAMSDEDLAEWLTEFANEAFAAGAIRFGGALMTEHDRLTWLKQSAEDGKR